MPKANCFSDIASQGGDAALNQNTLPPFLSREAFFRLTRFTQSEAMPTGQRCNTPAAVHRPHTGGVGQHAAVMLRSQPTARHAFDWFEWGSAQSAQPPTIFQRRGQ